MSEWGDYFRQSVLRVIQHCPRCQNPFADGDVRFLGRVNATWYLSLHCPSCHTTAIIGLAPAASEAPEGPRGESPVSADEVIDMHLWLEQTNSLPDFR